MTLMVVSCRKPEAAKRIEFSYPTQIGIVVKKSAQTCLAITNPALSPGSSLDAVSAEPPQTIAKVEVQAKAPDACKDMTAAEVLGELYAVRIVKGDLPSSTPAFAIYGYSGQFEKSGGSVAADLNSDGKKEYFRSCASTEGLHLTVWVGKPLDGTRKWHEYYYLGYDTEADCTPLDVPEQE